MNRKARTVNSFTHFSSAVVLIRTYTLGFFRQHNVMTLTLISTLICVQWLTFVHNGNLLTTVASINVNEKFEIKLTRRAKAYSSSCLQTVSLSPAVFTKDWPTTVKERLLQGYRSLMPSCAGFLEPRKWRLQPSKPTFNAKNFIPSLSISISIGFSAIRSWKVSHSSKSPKKSIQTPI